MFPKNDTEYQALVKEIKQLIQDGHKDTAAKRLGDLLFVTSLPKQQPNQAKHEIVYQQYIYFKQQLNQKNIADDEAVLIGRYLIKLLTEFCNFEELFPNGKPYLQVTTSNDEKQTTAPVVLTPEAIMLAGLDLDDIEAFNQEFNTRNDFFICFFYRILAHFKILEDFELANKNLVFAQLHCTSSEIRGRFALLGALEAFKINPTTADNILASVSFSDPANIIKVNTIRNQLKSLIGQPEALQEAIDRAEYALLQDLKAHLEKEQIQTSTLSISSSSNSSFSAATNAGQSSLSTSAVNTNSNNSNPRTATTKRKSTVQPPELKQNSSSSNATLDPNTDVLSLLPLLLEKQPRLVSTSPKWSIVPDSKSDAKQDSLSATNNNPLITILNELIKKYQTAENDHIAKLTVHMLAFLTSPQKYENYEKLYFACIRYFLKEDDYDNALASLQLYCDKNTFHMDSFEPIQSLFDYALKIAQDAIDMRTRDKGFKVCVDSVFPNLGKIIDILDNIYQQLKLTIVVPNAPRLQPTSATSANTEPHALSLDVTPTTAHADSTQPASSVFQPARLA